MSNRPSDFLLEGRRALEHLPFCQMLTDWIWFPVVSRWGLLCRITVDPCGLVPEFTDWYLVVDESYPWGKIDIYPAKEGGLQHTFLHQLHNGTGNEKLPWREGKICTDTSLRSFGRRMYDVEPFTAVDRLSWHVSRLQDWVICASQNRLSDPGDPFEMPDFPGTSPFFEIAFSEDVNSFAFWEECPISTGLVDFAHPANNPAILAVTAFKDTNGHVIRRTQHGGTSTLKVSKTGLWIRVSSVPCAAPWQAPVTFGELMQAISAQGIGLDHTLGNLTKNIRDGVAHPFLIGFPIPLKQGAVNERYHWQGLLLPVLSHGKLNGYRSIEKAYALRDKDQILTDSVRLMWLKSRNWDANEITARGRLSEALISLKILIIGVGALGSMICELLARAGCRHLVLVDGECLQIGNMSRHTLEIDDLCKMKAPALASRLKSVNPNMDVFAIDTKFPPVDHLHCTTVTDCEVVIDCTGDDTVLHQASLFEWHTNKYFFSASVGLYARRLFLFSSHSPSFPHSTFIEQIRPWIDSELHEYSGSNLPRDGIGCWHPVFPARADDLWIMASTAVKRIEEIVAAPTTDTKLDVYEQIQDEGIFQGIRKIY